MGGWTHVDHLRDSLVESCVSIICSCMPAIPAILHLIVSNSYFTTLRSRLLPPYPSSSKSYSSQGSSPRRVFPGKKCSNESEPYIELVDAGRDPLGTRSATKSQIQHVARPDLPTNSGINMSVELEISSNKLNCTAT